MCISFFVSFQSKLLQHASKSLLIYLMNNNMKTNPFNCKMCREQFPIKNLEKHVLKNHFDSDEGGLCVFAFRK